MRWRTAHLVLTALAITGPVHGQRLRQVETPPAEAPKPVLERSAPIENLFKRAQEGIDRQDWKLAIDSLQRVVDEPGGALVEDVSSAGEPPNLAPAPAGRERTGVVHYGSARRKAVRMLATMPDEGREAYRLLYDGQAQAMLERARGKADEATLRTIVDRYLLSSSGAEAADLLAGWLLDRGSPAQALAALDDAETAAVAGSRPRWRIALKRAVALGMMGETARAGQALDALPAETMSAPDAREAVERVRSMLASGVLLRGDQPETDGESWPLTGGEPRRRNVMPAVAAQLRESLPWRAPLTGAEAGWWEAHCLAMAPRNGKAAQSPPALAERIVATGAVLGAGRVFVGGSGGLAAFDPDGLTPLWFVEPGAETLVEGRLRARGFGIPELLLASVRLSERDLILYDHVGSSLTVAAGKVLAVDSRGFGAARAKASAGAGSSGDNVLVRGNRLLAYDVEQGRLLWQRGRTGDPDDELGDVYFRAPPLALGGELWAPYVKGADLLVGVLSPDDGRLLRKLVVCSIDEQHWAERNHEALMPAADGRLVFVPTGVGVLAAVDAHSFALQWAVTYPRNVALATRENVTPTSWLCGPPVVAGDTVLLAEMDSDNLLAIEAQTGQLRWVQPRPEGVGYVLAAQADRVWLGGDSVECRSVADGSVVWRAEAGRGQVTGRGALSGSSVLLPTTEGVAALDAATGQAGEFQESPADQPPLGNLLCAAGAMFSVDPNELRKFPDLAQSYPRQLAAYQARPGDPQAAVRLAWMELLRGEPQRAQTVLESVHPTSATPVRLAADIAHLRVGALLGLADRAAGESADQAIEHLRKALAIAATGEDRLRCATGLAGALRRAGRTGEAYALLWGVGRSAAADGDVTLAPRLRGKARLAIDASLRQWERDLTAGDLQSLAAEADAVVEAARRAASDSPAGSDGQRELQRLAEINDAGGAGQRAALVLGRTQREHERFEHSEQYFQRAIQMNRVGRRTAEALRDLAEQYVGGQIACPRMAGPLLDRLQTQFADLEIAAAGGSDGENAGRVAAAAETARLRQRIDQPLLKQNGALERPRRFRLGVRLAQKLADAAIPPAVFDCLPVRPEAAYNLVFVQPTPDTITALTVLDTADAGATGASAYAARLVKLWEARLRLLGLHEEDFREGTAENDAETVEDIHPVVWCDGQTGVVATRRGLFGIGLSSGRRLWGVEFQGSTGGDPAEERRRPVTAGEGLVVFSPRPGVLTAASIVDGEDVRWERLLPDAPPTSLRFEDRLLVAADDATGVVRTLLPATGALLATLTFQSDLPLLDEVIPAVAVDGFLIGPSGMDEVVCYDARTGTENWRQRLDEPLAWLCRPGGGQVAVGGENGRLTLVEVLDGRVVMNTVVPGLTGGVADAVRHGDKLVLMSVEAGAHGPEPVLVGLEVPSGGVGWRRHGFGATDVQRDLLPRLLRVAEDVVPMFQRDVAPSPTGGRVYSISVHLVDKDTGEDYGPTAMTNSPGDMLEEPVGWVELFPRRLMLGTRMGIVGVGVWVKDGGPTP